MIPAEWDKARLLLELRKVDTELEKLYPEYVELSICPSGSTNTALLEFKNSGTEFFRALSPDEDNFVLGDLIIDLNFFGFTVLHSPVGEITAEYSDLFLTFKYLCHEISRRSPQVPNELGVEWAAR